MRLTTLSLVFITLFFCSSGLLAQPFSTPGKQVAVKKRIDFSRPNSSDNVPYGFYEYLPQDFSMTSGKKFPLVIFYHGAGQRGDGKDDLFKVLNVGPPRMIENGRHFPAIFISPQTLYGFSPQDFERQLDYFLEKGYPIDTDRIYLTGLSAGGGDVWKALENYQDRIAATIPICGSRKLDLTAHHLLGNKIWAFHNYGDTVVFRKQSDENLDIIVNDGSSVITYYPSARGGSMSHTMNFVDGEWEDNSGIVKPTENMAYTIYRSNEHNAWTRTYNNDKVWDWLFAQSLDTDTNGGNTPLTVDAGPDVVIQRSTPMISLEGTATKRISNYQWRKISGPSTITLNNTNAKKLRLSAYAVGTYTFELEVTDLDGNKAKDEVSLRVMANLSVSAGEDKVVDLNTNTFLTLRAITNRPVSRFTWLKISGPSVSLQGVHTANLKLDGLKVGNYRLRVRAVDAFGHAVVDDVKVEVVKPPNSPLPDLTVTLGANRTVPISEPSFTLTATPNRAVRDYEWEQIHGPSITLQGMDRASLVMSDLIVGTYNFSVKVTTIDGQTAMDYIRVDVVAPSSMPLSVMAEDMSIDIEEGSVTVVSTANQPVENYEWVKLSGPSATIIEDDSKDLVLNDLRVGQYEFRVAVEDGSGRRATDKVLIEVTTDELAPLVYAGADATITTDESSWDLAAAANGSVISFNWQKLSGPVVTMENKNQRIVTLSGFVPGTYVFGVTVANQSHLTAFDIVEMTVLAGRRNIASRKLPIVDGSVSSEEKALVETVIYPNPSIGQVNITSKGDHKKVSISDATFKIVKELEFNEDNITVDLSDYPRGVYWIRISNGSSIENKRLLLE